MGTCRRAGSRPRRGTMIKLLLLLVLSQGTLQSPRRQQARHYDQDWMKYMIGEVFFKENSNQGNQQIFEDDYSEDDDTEEIPYSVLERYNGYEKRYYAPATFVCNNVTDIDTAADPLAGLDDMNPFELMGSKRYKKSHQSRMFMEFPLHFWCKSEARRNRDDQTGGRLPQRDEGDSTGKLRGCLYVFLPSLQVPGRSPAH